MTEAEKALLDFAVKAGGAYQIDQCPTFRKLRAEVAMERLNERLPNWRSLYIETAVSHFRMERKFLELKAKIRECGFDPDAGSAGRELFEEAWKAAFPSEEG